jgi:phage major head subunit gpT-like protein
MALAGSPMTRDHISLLMELGVRQVFLDEYELVDNDLEMIYNIVDSRKRQETDVVTAGLSVYQIKPEGDAPDFDNGQQAWSVVYTHKTWGLGIEITEEAIEDDLYDYYTSMGRELGKAGAYTQQVQAFDLFNNLNATVYTAGGTGYGLLSTTHFRVDGQTWSNRPTVSTDLSLESLETFLINWRTGMVDQRGRKITVQPETLMVGPSDEFVAHRLLESDKRPFSADNDVNAVKERRRLKVFVADFMTDDTRWFLLANKRRTGLRYNLRAKREMRRRDDPRTGNMLLVGRYDNPVATAAPMVN